MIKDTSMQAYSEINNDGTSASQRMIILKHIRSFDEGLIRAEISEQLNLPINCVCGRVKELLSLKSIYEEGKRMNRESGKMNLVLKPNEIKVYEQ